MMSNRRRAAGLLTLVFAAGVTGGLAAERYALHDLRLEAGERDGHADGRTTIERFADELGVTPEQRALIDPILVDTRERMTEVYDRFRPEWQAVVDSARLRIEAVLTPQQVEQYRALLEEQEQKEKDRRGER